MTNLYCANHPNTETSLRCNRCDKPICIKCAVRTPTGYRCRECIRGQQKTFETAQWQDIPLALFVSGILSFLGSLIAGFMGFFVLFIAPIAGTIIAESIRSITKRRRSQNLFIVVAIGTFLGGLPLLLRDLFFGYISLSIIWKGVYLITATTTAYYRIKGIFLNR
jgi:hypothetical protein